MGVRRHWQIGLILLLALVLRLRGLGHQSLWIDETLTYRSATAPFAGLLDRIQHMENMPPGHMYLMNVWVRGFGATDYSLRFPSAMCGVLSVWMMYQFVRRALGTDPFGHRVALAAALLLAVSRFHIAYSQEARSYSLLFFLALVSCHEWVVLLRGPSRRAPAVYAVCAGAMLWVHTFAAFLMLAQLLAAVPFVAPRWRLGGRPALARALLAQTAASLIYAPYIQESINVAQAGQAWMPRPTLPDTLLAYVGQPWLLGAFLALAVYATVQLWRRRQIGAATLWALVATLPVALPLALSQGKHVIFTPRYGIAGLIGLYALVGCGLIALPRAAGVIASFVLAALMLPPVAGDFARGVNAQLKPDTRSAADEISRRARPGDRLLCADYFRAAAMDVYLPASRMPRLADAPPPDAAAAADLPPRIWLLVHPDFVPPGGGVPGYRVASTRTYQLVSLIELTRAAATQPAGAPPATSPNPAPAGP